MHCHDGFFVERALNGGGGGIEDAAYPLKLPSESSPGVRVVNSLAGNRG